jgi:hypothetical protein
MLAMRDRDRANMNEIEIVVFSVTSNDFFSLHAPAHFRARSLCCARTTSGQGGLAVTVGQVQADIRTHLIHRPARDSTVALDQ